MCSTKEDLQNCDFVHAAAETQFPKHFPSSGVESKLSSPPQGFEKLFDTLLQNSPGLGPLLLQILVSMLMQGKGVVVQALDHGCRVVEGHSNWKNRIKRLKRMNF